ncbi:MAG: response regulator [Bacteroidota bacterium]
MTIPVNQDKITALIVDDDAKSREVLEFHLWTIPEVEIIGSAASADEAYRILLELVPDLIFLDIEMPEKSGFDLLVER